MSAEKQMKAGGVGALVAGARRRIRMASAVGGICRWVVSALGLWLAFFVLDNVLALPAGLRLPLAVAGGLLLVGMLLRRVVLPAFSPLGMERVAVIMESRFGIRENLLINAYQLERRNLGPAETMFADRTIQGVESAVGAIEMRQLWDAGRLAPWVLSALLVLGGWVAYGILFPKFLVNATQRYVMPLSDVAPPGAPVIIMSPAEDVLVAEGDSLNVRVEVQDNRPVAAGRDESPVIAWMENVKSVPPVRGRGEEAEMAAVPGQKGAWEHAFAGIRRPFAFRVFAAGMYTDSIKVRVHAIPKITSSLFRVVPPAYTGLGAVTNAGPPAALSALAGSIVEVEVGVAPAPKSLRWSDPSGAVELKLRDGKWRGARALHGAAAYEIEARIAKLDRDVVIARASMQVSADAAPEVEFAVADRNRFAFPGGVVPLAVRARDDFGLKAVWITAKASEAEHGETAEVKRWAYVVPPGRKEETQERVEMKVDPAFFRAGATYLLEAWAADFNPGAAASVSKPILLRIRSPLEADLERGDPLVQGFERLKQTLAAQERANALTSNLRAHLDEALAKQDMPEHRRVIGEAQDAALQSGRGALDVFQSIEEGKRHAATLGPLVSGEMPWALNDAGRLAGADAAGTGRLVEAIIKRQEYIRDALMFLLGRIAEERREKAAEAKAGRQTPKASAKELAKDLKTGAKRFMQKQKRVLARSKPLAEKAPGDLTEKEEAEVGELAREEAEWAKFFQEKAAEFAKLPPEDPADSSLTSKLNEVSQKVQAAADALYKKDAKLAVPEEEAGVEGAKQLVEDIEKSMPKPPEEVAREKEERPAVPETPLAVPPSELEDMVGKLLDAEAALGGGVDEIPAGQRDTADKESAGRVGDGPIASMRARGVDGNVLPGENDIGGRSKEGRSGRSTGEMVGESAEGKGGAATPARLVPSAFDQGIIQDKETKDPGGATGGGKKAGFSSEGLAGTPPAPPEERAPRLAEQQALIRQRAEALTLRLRSHRLPTGDLENSIQAMRQFEQGARTGDGFAVQQSYSSALDALAEAHATVKAGGGLLRERASLPPWIRDEITAGLREAIPQGYDEMISAYFRALAEGQAAQEAETARTSHPSGKNP